MGKKKTQKQNGSSSSDQPKIESSHKGGTCSYCGKYYSTRLARHEEIHLRPNSLKRLNNPSEKSAISKRSRSAVDNGSAPSSSSTSSSQDEKQMQKDENQEVLTLDSQQPILKCESCGKSFPFAGILQKHLKTCGSSSSLGKGQEHWTPIKGCRNSWKHLVVGRDQKGRQVYNCPICLKNVINYSDHYWQNHSEEYKCTYCDATFGKISIKNDHEKSCIGPQTQTQPQIQIQACDDDSDVSSEAEPQPEATLDSNLRYADVCDVEMYENERDLNVVPIPMSDLKPTGLPSGSSAVDTAPLREGRWSQTPVLSSTTMHLSHNSNFVHLSSSDDDIDGGDENAGDGQGQGFPCSICKAEFFFPSQLLLHEYVHLYRVQTEQTIKPTIP